MRLVVGMPGHDYSTHDVYEGLVFGLRQQGHHVVEYDVGVRLDMAAAARYEAWGQAHWQPDLKPGLGDVLYEAGHAMYAAIIEHGADAVVIVSADLWHPQHLANLRKADMVLGVVHTEGPYWDHLLAGRFRGVDVVWCQERSSPGNLVHYWAQDPSLGPVPMVRYLPHGYHPERHNTDPWPELDAKAPAHDLVFVGTYFQERIKFLEELHATGVLHDLDVGLYGHVGLMRSPGFLGVSKRRPVFPGDWRLRLLRLLARMGHSSTSPLWQYVRGGVVPNELTRAMYRKAAIGLNLFRGSEKLTEDSVQVPGAGSMNPRCYELAACGAFFLSDRRPELAEVFAEAVPTFDTATEAAQLLRQYMATPADRQSLVARARASVAPHSYTNRAAQMVEDLQRAKAKQSAGALAPTLTGASCPISATGGVG